MLVFLVLCVILCQNVVITVANRPYDTIPPLLPAFDPQITGNLAPKVDEKCNCSALHQTFHTKNLDKVDRKIPSDYTMTNGIGAHKLNLTRLTWNRARRACIEEGGHLAIIRSDFEGKIILQKMVEGGAIKKPINTAWVGYHDQFEEDDWVSVMDEPLAQTNWARWSTAFKENPDNRGGIQHCGALIRFGGGLDDQGCDNEHPFVCKISID